MVSSVLSPLPFNVKIVDPKTGYPDPFFQRMLSDWLKEKAAAEEAAITLDSLGGDPGADRLIFWDDSAGVFSFITTAQALLDTLGGDPGADKLIKWKDSTNEFVFISTSDALDLIGSTQGQILYRGASGWSALGTGTSGQYLKTQGAGANPTWATVTTGAATERTRTLPLVANFTLENAGTASMADGTWGLVTTVPTTTSNIRFVRKTSGIPATPYTVITRCEALYPVSNSAKGLMPIVFRNSTSGRMILVNYTAGLMALQRWTNYTTFSANIATPTVFWPNINWLKVTNNGTTLTFYTSVNGDDWSVFPNTEALATFINAAGGTTDQVGFASWTSSLGSTFSDVFQSFEIF